MHRADAMELHWIDCQYPAGAKRSRVARAIRCHNGCGGDNKR